MLPNNQAQRQKQENQFRKNLSIPTFVILPLLTLTNFQFYFMAVYMFVAIGLLAYKATILPLPNYAVACQGIILAMMCLTQLLRWGIVKQAISNKQVKYIIFYIIGSIFVLLSYIFQLKLQTYVVLAEIITNWTGIGFLILQILGSFWLLKVVHHKKRSV